MLRTFKPIQHKIFQLHEIVKHLVCGVWCKADNDICTTKMSVELKDLYDNYEDLKKVVDEVYEIFKSLTLTEKEKVREAFYVNNQIEKLCNKDLTPIYLKELPSVVEEKIKPLFTDFYNKYLGYVKVAGDKLDYYQKLYLANDFEKCPCCGLVPFEDDESERREAFDHYLPKALYPFASVNFGNLVPLCYKCNSDWKKTKDPIKNNRKTVYPFGEDQEIKIKIDYNSQIDFENPKEEDFEVVFNGKDLDKIDTWDWLFNMKSRYSRRSKKLSQRVLRTYNNRYKHMKQGVVDDIEIIKAQGVIENWNNDFWEDENFLKIPLLESLVNKGLVE